MKLFSTPSDITKDLCSQDPQPSAAVCEPDTSSAQGAADRIQRGSSPIPGAGSGGPGGTSGRAKGEPNLV